MLQACGFTDAVQPKLVMAKRIAPTCPFVVTGNAESGFVALAQTQAAVPGKPFTASMWRADEFGVGLMVGRSIMGELRMLSVALFEHVQAAEVDQAHQLAAGKVM